jgi:GNAT superfamily N-acetyltransferase
VQIVAFPNDPKARRQAAELLVEAFPHENGWPTLELALEEIDEALAPERRCLAALDGDQLLGWIAGIPNYRERVWELHPLVVRGDARGRGIGRALTRELERVAAAGGGLTMWVGPDDDLGVTSLAGVDVYPAPLDRLRELVFPGSHAIGFYLRVGYTLCGVVPDANGRGLHGILLARRIGVDD